MDDKFQYAKINNNNNPEYILNISFSRSWYKQCHQHSMENRVTYARMAIPIAEKRAHASATERATCKVKETKQGRRVSIDSCALLTQTHWNYRAFFLRVLIRQWNIGQLQSSVETKRGKYTYLD